MDISKDPPSESIAIEKLRQRYASLRLSTEEDFQDDISASPSAIGDSTPPINDGSPMRKGRKSKWSLLKTAIMMIPEKSEGSLKSDPSNKYLAPSTSEVYSPEKAVEDADQLLRFWNDDTITDVPVPTISVDFDDVEPGNEAEQKATAAAVTDTDVNYVDRFATESRDVSLVISKIPEDIILEKKKRLDAELVAEKSRAAQELVKEQAKLLYKENEARERVQRLQDEAMLKVKQSKEEMVKELFKRESAIDREFRRAREALEEDLKKEQASLREKHGELTTGQESISRRYEVKWNLSPQPIEMRIHVLRAVKNKLPKGSYVIMLTQFDRLGGKPMGWTVSGMYGIDSNRPATTRPFRHHGRFFDRVLKVEDSTFALCPPAEKLRPGNVLIIELFQLATRRNPTNRVIGWAALPMCTPQFSVVEGRFKLPILRGEHTPAIQHYRTIEAIIGEDLNEWLCNIYVEVKHLPKFFVNRDGTSMDEYQIEFNYMKKLLSIGNVDHHKLNGPPGALDPLTPVPIEPKQQFDTEIDDDNNQDFDGGDTFADPSEHDSLNYSRSTYNAKLNRSVPKSQSGNDLLQMSDSSSIGIARQRGKSSGASSAHSSQFTLNLRHHSENPNDFSDEDSQQKSRMSSIDDMWRSVRGVFAGNEGKREISDSSRLEGTSLSGNNRAGSKVRFSGSGALYRNEVTTDEEEDDPLEVLERGYDPEDEFFLDSQQIGKLSGLETIGKDEDREWAASGIGNGIVRRWQSDGSRYDSEALSSHLAHKKLNSDLEEKRRKMLGEIDSHGRFTTWTPLSDKKDFDLYSVSVASDPARRRKLLPSALVKSKLRFILQEAIGDLYIENWGSFDFYVTVIVYLITLWVRMSVHYIGQYFFLEAVRTPVYSFRLGVYEIIFKYISTAVPVAYEVALVVMGPLSNIFCFICLAFLSRMFYRYAKSLPDSVSLFICAYGVWTVLDPYIILIVDVASHNYRCGEYDESCKNDYTSSNCQCFNGDWFKLWTRYRRDEGSGVTGLFITVMLYFATTVIALVLLYEYLVLVHKDSRILDIWRRLNAPPEELFIPLDFELSLDELRTICASASAWKGPAGASRRLVVSEYVETDPFDEQFKAVTRHFAIYELDMDGKRKLYRHFLKLHDGSIIEIFEQLTIDISSQYRTLEHLLGQEGKLAFHSQHQRIFAGIENI